MEILCIDIGGSKFSSAISNENGEFRNKSTNSLYVGMGADKLVIQRIFEFADRIIDRNPDIECIGISVPGLTDSENGIWIFSPFSGIKNVNLRKLFGDRYGLPVFAENDVNARALAEKKFGLCKDEQDYMWITVTNGVGGSFVINGKLFKGTNGNAGEIGHIVVVDENGAKCGCGNKGCLETVASGNGIETAYKSLHPEIDKPVEELIARAMFGDEDMRSILYKAGYNIGKAVATTANLLDLDLYVFGGNIITYAYDFLEPGIRDGLDRFVFKNTGLKIRTKRTALGVDTGLIAAATIALIGMENGQY